ncbi:MAG: VCBS repeat-containing protein [Cyclobacteriaceae bacterium]|nr:VCBS repeat-containing protein [Cyclobacteriaceae bacterium]
MFIFPPLHTRNLLVKFLFAGLLCVSASSLVQGQITSTFDTDTEGWVVTDINNQAPQSITFNASGGNPGGFASAVITSIYGHYWTSPAKFNGNIAYRSYGQLLRYDLQINVTPTVHSIYGDVMIDATSGHRIVYTHPDFPAVSPGWQSFSVRLDETVDWRWGGANGPVATRQQIMTVLTDVRGIRISGQYTNTQPIISGIDNVILEQRSPLPPRPAVSSMSSNSGAPGTSITINGSNFSPIASENLVQFGGISGTITAASSSALTVTVPIGARYGNVTIINKATGLIHETVKPFTPTFKDGGRIIPASFKPALDIVSDALGNTASGSINGIQAFDMDGDGWSDIIASSSGNNVSVYRNLGAGGEITSTSFAAPVILGGGGNSGSLRIADLDGDGKPDIISSYSDGWLMSFTTFRNTSSPGALSFEPVALWSGLVYSGRLSDVVDVDGDGLPDLVGQHGAGSGAVDFWIAQNISTPGKIRFAHSISYFGAALLDAGAGATAGDLNGDGKPDFVVRHWFGSVFSIITNTSTPGAISFEGPASFSQGSNGDFFVLADFNEDGKLDIAWRQGFNNDDVRIRLNTNTGGVITAADFATEVILDTDIFNGGAVTIGDINGDEKPDLITTDSEKMAIFENVFSGGAFNANALVPGFLLPVGLYINGNASAPAVADLNHNGKPDLIFAMNTTPIRIMVMENKNTHAPVISLNTVSPLSAPVGSTITITGNYFSTVLDENHVTIGGVKATVTSATPDELKVIVPEGASQGMVSVTRDGLTGQYHLPFTVAFGAGVDFSDAHFAPPVSFTLSGARYDPVVTDLNNDGKPDIMADGTSGSFAFRNTHSNGNITASSLSMSGPISNATTPTLFDLDGDTRIDLVGGSNIYRNVSSADPIEYNSPVTLPPGGFYFNGFADFNQDGKIDLISVAWSAVYLVENRTREGEFVGLGYASSFGNAIAYPKPSDGGSVVAADFDNDGETDFAATNPTTDNVSVWRNNGAFRITNTQFTALPTIAVGDNPSRIYTGDFDRDGKIDLLIIHATGTTTTQITILQNQSTPGTISFSAPINLTNTSALTVAHVADLDGDGKPEIITTSESGNRFSIFKNIHTSGALTAASFAAPFNTTVTGPRGLTTGDLNLDGKPEIIITRAAGFLVVYENLIPTTSITISTQPITPNNVCVGSSTSFTTAATGTTNITYQWQKFDGSVFVDLVNNTTYSGVTTASLSIANASASEAGDYRCLIKGDLAADIFTNVATLVVNALPLPPDASDATRCGPGSVTLTASGGAPGEYRWYTQTPLELITGEVNETFTTPVLAASTNYLVSIANAFCESNRVTVTAIISSVPEQPVIASSITPVANAVSVCSSSTLTLTAPAGFASYLWSNGETTQQISPASSGAYSVTVTNAGGCVSPVSVSLTVTIIPEPCGNQPPIIISTLTGLSIEGVVRIDLTPLLSDPDDNLDLGSLRVLNTQTTAGASASINAANELILNYGGVLFTGQDRISIEVCDLLGACTQQQLTIYVEGDIIVRTGFSPNGDGQNDFFQIDYINLFPDTQQNKVTIFNRWGDMVFEMANYDNQSRVFRGLSRNGNELPSGTYFYRIEFTSGRAVKVGYLSLKK